MLLAQRGKETRGGEAEVNEAWSHALPITDKRNDVISGSGKVGYVLGDCCSLAAGVDGDYAGV